MSRMETSDGTATKRLTAALLIAHGSRKKEANDDLVRLADQVAASGRYPIVEIAYLELTTPTIPEGGRACVSRGAEQVRMLPFFLSAGAHVTDDLERFRHELSQEFPDSTFVVCPPLGLHPKLVEVVFDRLEEEK